MQTDTPGKNIAVMRARRAAIYDPLKANDHLKAKHVQHIAQNTARWNAR